MQVSVIVEWAKKHPLVAGLYGLGALFVIVLIIVIVSTLRQPAGPTKRDLSALEQEPNIAKRVRKLAELQQTREPMSVLFQALTHTDPVPEDLVALQRIAAEMDPIENDDFAWAVVIDTRLRRGIWPAYPEAPPQDPRVAGQLRDSLQRNNRIDVSLPKDLVLREQWLKFALETKDPKSPVFAELYNDKDTQEGHLLLYQQVVAIGPTGEWFAQQLYTKLELLPEPLFVLDTDTSIQAPQVARGPENTLLFLGVLEGERCAIAMVNKPLPPLWVRPCRGLEPRRLARGELFLLGVDTKYDAETPMHWLPVLLEDSGSIVYGSTLRAKVDDRVLAAFIVSAPRFVNGKPFAPELELTTANAQDEKLPSFKTKPEGKPTPAIMTFSARAKVKVKPCGRLDKSRCAPLLTDDDRCDLGPSLCAEFVGGATLRWTRTTLIKPEPCLKEYGHKSNCPVTTTTGLFLDLKTTSDFIKVGTGTTF